MVVFRQRHTVESGRVVQRRRGLEVLLALIRNPNLSPARLARSLRGHSPPIRLAKITPVLQRYDLQQVAE